MEVLVLHGIVVDGNEQLGFVRPCQTCSPLQRECIGGGNDVGFNVGSSRKSSVDLLHDRFVELIFWNSAGADRAGMSWCMPDVESNDMFDRSCDVPGHIQLLPQQKCSERE